MGVVSLIVGITGDVSGLQKSLGSAGQEVKGFGGISLATAAKVTVVGAIAITAAEALWDMGKAADADRTEQMKLKAAIEQAGAATGDYMAQVDAAIAQGQDKAFTDTETRNALQSLVTATGDVTAATGLLTGAQDLARFSNVSLEVAADALAKAHAGNDKALRTLVPGLIKGANAADTIADATHRAAGQANIFANSAEGGAMRAADGMSELGETVGELVLPLMDALVPVIIQIVKALTQIIKAVLPVLIPMLQVLGKWWGFLATIISGVVGWVIKLISWLGDLLRPIGQVLDALSHLSVFGDIIGMVTGGPGGTFMGTGGPGSTANFTFNIHGDPSVIEQTVVRALRQYTRRNGYVTVGLADH
jgi:hypothetical protein